MKNKLRKLCTSVLLILIVLQATSVILLETDILPDEAAEAHEIIGFSIFGFILLHVFFFWKSLKANLFTRK
jgi:hypothetical protein